MLHVGATLGGCLHGGFRLRGCGTVDYIGNMVIWVIRLYVYIYYAVILCGYIVTFIWLYRLYGYIGYMVIYICIYIIWLCYVLYIHICIIWLHYMVIWLHLYDYIGYMVI